MINCKKKKKFQFLLFIAITPMNYELPNVENCFYVTIDVSEEPARGDGVSTIAVVDGSPVETPDDSSDNVSMENSVGEHSSSMAVPSAMDASKGSTVEAPHDPSDNVSMDDFVGKDSSCVSKETVIPFLNY